jgi:AraC-like DNA-binding protein
MGDRLVVAGPDVSAAVTALSPGLTITGVRFQPGAAACWLGLPMSEIVGRRIDLVDLWGAKARDLADQLADPHAAGNVASRLQSALEHLTPDVARPPPDIDAIFRWTQERGAQTMPIRDRLSVSERSLRRRCRHFFGYGPKTLERILRFQHVLAAMRNAPACGLSELAFDAGYADQAHLSREAMALAGLSPGAIRRQLAG